MLGLVTRVSEEPSYLKRSPEPPPIRAKEPLGFQATALRSSPADITLAVDICVSVVPFHFRRTAVSPTISAYDPSGFQEISLRADVTGWPMSVRVPF